MWEVFRVISKWVVLNWDFLSQKRMWGNYDFNLSFFKLFYLLRLIIYCWLSVSRRFWCYYFLQLYLKKCLNCIWNKIFIVKIYVRLSIVCVLHEKRPTQTGYMWFHRSSDWQQHKMFLKVAQMNNLMTSDSFLQRPSIQLQYFWRLLIYSLIPNIRTKLGVYSHTNVLFSL